MTRRGFLGLVGSVPFFGFLKGGESAEAKSSPPREAVGSAAMYSRDMVYAVTVKCLCGNTWTRQISPPVEFMTANWAQHDPPEPCSGCGADFWLNHEFHQRRYNVMANVAAPKGGAS